MVSRGSGKRQMLGKRSSWSGWLSLLYLARSDKCDIEVQKLLLRAEDNARRNAWRSIESMRICLPIALATAVLTFTGCGRQSVVSEAVAPTGAQVGVANGVPLSLGKVEVVNDTDRPRPATVLGSVLVKFPKGPPAKETIMGWIAEVGSPKLGATGDADFRYVVSGSETKPVAVRISKRFLVPARTTIEVDFAVAVSKFNPPVWYLEAELLPQVVTSLPLEASSSPK